MATVNSSATSVTLLASDSTRKGGVIRNTDANQLTIHLGSSSASSTNVHYTLNTNDTLELPPGYKGAVQGIWAAAGSGGAQIRDWN